MFTITGQIVDIINGNIFPGKIVIESGLIKSIDYLASAPSRLICPGLVDAHVHVESSLLVPSEFARVALCHGTIASVADPHEIANVLGIKGVKFMLENGSITPFYFCWGAPSCVPATDFETAGGELGLKEIEELLGLSQVGFLAEMMNFPGVITRDKLVLEKIALAKALDKPIDGHAPLLRGDELSAYIRAGISTDHESTSLEEAREKIEKGMKILIREGSAAKNFETLKPLLLEVPEMCMFSTDDAHPSAFLRGHINQLVRRACDFGVPFLTALRVASLNPIMHYKLNCGLLRLGDRADFIVVPDPSSMEVEATFIKGREVASDGFSKLTHVPVSPINNFSRCEINERELHLAAAEGELRVIRVNDGELITGEELVTPAIEDGLVMPDLENDVLKLVVVNRYQAIGKPAVSFVRGFGLKKGAIASSVCHDSHNIIAVGTSDRELLHAINTIIKHRGGLVLVEGKETVVLPLPVAGLMSIYPAEEVERIESELNAAARELGTTLTAPFTTLSFLSLLVIPKLKLSDRGLFDGESFKFVSQFAL